MSVLVVDVGTSGLRAAVVRPDGTVDGLHFRPFPPSSPFPGLVEFDAAAMATAKTSHLPKTSGVSASGSGLG